jgi:hypothetical protein
VGAARVRLAEVPPFEVRFGATAVTPEAVETFADPAESTATVRSAIRQAIGEMLPEVPAACSPRGSQHGTRGRSLDMRLS